MSIAISLPVNTKQSIKIGKCLKKSVTLNKITKQAMELNVTTLTQFPLKIGDS